MDEEICSAVLEEPPSGAVEERNTAEECKAPAPPRVAWGNNSSENHSKWMIFHADVLRVWNAGKRLFQTNETHVCAFVPSQELPHTPSVESRPTDPLESKPTDPLESRPTDPLESRPTDLHKSKPTDPLESRPTDPLESRPTDPLESKLTDPLKSRPTDPLESKPTDPPRSRPGRRTRSCPCRQTLPVQVQADRPAPLESRPTDRSFESLYEVVKKVKSRGDRSDYLGFRNPDIKRVIISYIKKSQPEKLVELPDYPIPLSRDAAAMLMLQKPPTSTHINQLYDIFVMEDQDVLVMEYPHHSMTLFEFVQQNQGSLTECVVKHIVRELVVALQHCLDHGVYCDTHMKKILINPNTLQVKLMDFGSALLFEERPVREYAEWAVTDIRKLLDALVPRKGHWFWQRSHLSKECLDLLEKLNDSGSQITLDAMLHHDWFKNPSERR